jgi:predicted component of type VI protein secretion system
MKKVYMDRQNVTVNVKRFGELLKSARLHLKNNTAAACRHHRGAEVQRR